MPSLDNPTANDRLGFEPYVRGLEDLIRDIESADLPAAVGIYGSWGSGKTSFMMQLRARLAAETGNGAPPLPTVWFEAWKYDRAEDVRGALINRILTTLEGLASSSVKRTIAEKVKLVRRVMVGLATRSRLSLGVAGAGVNMASLQEVLEYAEQTAKFHVAVDEFAGAFGEAVSAVLEQTEPTTGRKLVIFIDDLDRCMPENVMTILEALKLFMVESPCVFVIGVDRTIVEHAISAHYGVDPEVAGSEYLDKIVQHPFHIPPADPVKLREHFEQILGSMGFDEACPHVFPLAANNNPRAYLRLLSVWNLVAHLAPHVAPKVWGGSHKKVLAIVVALQVCFPALYRVCKANPGGLIGFTEACIDPPRQEIGDYLSARRAQEYTSFWRDASVRRFFSGLKGPLGDGVTDILGSEATLKQALNLSDLVA